MSFIYLFFIRDNYIWGACSLILNVDIFFSRNLNINDKLMTILRKNKSFSLDSINPLESSYEYLNKLTRT